MQSVTYDASTSAISMEVDKSKSTTAIQHLSEVDKLLCVSNVASDHWIPAFGNSLFTLNNIFKLRYTG